ncbi:MAG: hypothetical protein H6739_31490 [Alphaproteobacteria bacterium]|nr:hypothetical protein [Alphaproteobacteria bacterium]
MAVTVERLIHLARKRPKGLDKALSTADKATMAEALAVAAEDHPALSCTRTAAWKLGVAVLLRGGAQGWQDALAERFNAAHPGDAGAMLLDVTRRTLRTGRAPDRYDVVRQERDRIPDWREDLREPGMSEEDLDDYANEGVEIWMHDLSQKGLLRISPNLDVGLGLKVPAFPDMRDQLR